MGCSSSGDWTGSTPSCFGGEADILAVARSAGVCAGGDFVGNHVTGKEDGASWRPSMQAAGHWCNEDAEARKRLAACKQCRQDELGKQLTTYEGRQLRPSGEGGRELLVESARARGQPRP